VYSPAYEQDVYDAFKVVYDATEIYAACQPVYSDLTANSFNAYQVGQGAWRGVDKCCDD
jgi:hypothetical protein